MACGLYLGILLICLVQAEHVCCLWTRDAQSFQSQNGRAYVGFSQQDGRYGGRYPQNKFRQAWVRSLSAGTAANGGYYQGLLQPQQSSVQMAQSSLQRKLFPSPFDNVASGSSLSKCNGVSHVKQGTQGSTKYHPSSCVSVQSPSREGSHSNQHVAQKPPTADAPAYYGQTGPSRLFSKVGPPLPDRPPAQMQTSARAPARRVHHKPATQTKYRTDARKPYVSTLFPSLTPANSNYPATRTENAAQGSHHRFPVSMTGTVGTNIQIYRIPQRFGGYNIRRLKDPADQKKAAVQKYQTPHLHVGRSQHTRRIDRAPVRVRYGGG